MKNKFLANLEKTNGFLPLAEKTICLIEKK
jgi:hypothetical protein